MGSHVDDPASPIRAAELRWLAWCRDFCKELGATQQLTIGNYANATVWAPRDDAVHVDVLRFTLAELVRRDIGFTVHALHHSLVSDLHRVQYGPVGRQECLHFIEADGRLRAGHEAFTITHRAGVQSCCARCPRHQAEPDHVLRCSTTTP